ncbi:MAG TPA: hypothetical protein PLV96_09055 [Methanoregulaceae archaeon]|nr:hypothetical protein [Methanoregulaceae archaeon]
MKKGGGGNHEMVVVAGNFRASGADNYRRSILAIRILVGRILSRALALGFYRKRLGKKTLEEALEYIHFFSLHQIPNPGR